MLACADVDSRGVSVTTRRVPPSVGQSSNVTSETSPLAGHHWSERRRSGSTSPMSACLTVPSSSTIVPLPPGRISRSTGPPSQLAQLVAIGERVPDPGEVSLEVDLPSDVHDCLHLCSDGVVQLSGCTYDVQRTGCSIQEGCRARPHRDRTDQPRGAGLRHLLPPAVRADRVPRHARSTTQSPTS